MTRVEVGIALTRLVADWAAGTVADIPGALRALAADIDGQGEQLTLTPPEAAAVMDIAKTGLEIFRHWTTATRRDARARFTSERKAKVNRRLLDGYTAEQIKRAIDGCAASDFHNGTENGRRYDDLMLICRDGAHLESFMDMAPGEKRGPRAPESRELRLLRVRLQSAVDLSDDSMADRLRDEIAALGSEPTA